MCTWTAQGAAKIPKVKVWSMEKTVNDPLFNFSYVDCILGHIFHNFSDILWPLIVLQPIDLQGCIVPHLKVLKKEWLDLAEWYGNIFHYDFGNIYFQITSTITQLTTKIYLIMFLAMKKFQIFSDKVDYCFNI